MQAPNWISSISIGDEILVHFPWTGRSEYVIISDKEYYGLCYEDSRGCTQILRYDDYGSEPEAGKWYAYQVDKKKDPDKTSSMFDVPTNQRWSNQKHEGHSFLSQEILNEIHKEVVKEILLKTQKRSLNTSFEVNKFVKEMMVIHKRIFYGD